MLDVLGTKKNFSVKKRRDGGQPRLYVIMSIYRFYQLFVCGFASLFQFQFPIPCGAERIFQWGVGFPTEFCIGQCGVCPDLGDIAVSAWGNLVRDVYACRFFEGTDDFQDGDASTCTKVEGFDIFLVPVLYQTGYGVDMGLSQIYDVDVVADATSVWRVIVVSEYAQSFTDADGCLSDERKQVVRDAVWQLTNLCAWVCSDWVEVSQEDALHVGVGIDHVGKDGLAHLLCAAGGPLPDDQQPVPETRLGEGRGPEAELRLWNTERRKQREEE